MMVESGRSLELVCWRRKIVLLVAGAMFASMLLASGSQADAVPYSDAPRTPMVLFHTPADDRSAVSFDGHHVAFTADPWSGCDGGCHGTANVKVLDDSSTVPRLISTVYPDSGGQGQNVSQVAADNTAATVVAGYRGTGGLSCVLVATLAVCPWDTQQVVAWRGGAVRLVSESSSTAQPAPWPVPRPAGYVSPAVSRASFDPSISLDGNKVGFSSDAPDLVAGGADTNGKTDVFVRDITSLSAPGAVLRVSLTPTPTLGQIADGDSYEGRISPNGAHAVFTRRATAYGTNGNQQHDVYMADLSGGAVTAVRLASQTTGTGGVLPTRSGSSAQSYHPAVSNDGRWVTFVSDATNLVGNPGANDGNFHVYVRDTTTNVTSLAWSDAIVPGQTQGTAWPVPPEATPKVTPDGRWLLSNRNPSPVANTLNLPNFSGMGGSITSSTLAIFDLSNPDLTARFTQEKVGVGSINETSLTNVVNSRGVPGALGVWTGPDVVSNGHGSHIMLLASNDALLGGGGDLAWHGDPVDTGTGRFVQDGTDLTALAGVDGMTVSRYANSFDHADGSLGPSWRVGWDAHLNYLADGGLLYIDGSGRRTKFAYNATTQTWATPPEFSGTLALNATTHLFEITYWPKTKWSFDANGRLAQTDNGNGQVVTINRDAATGLPTTLVHSSGYTLTVTPDAGDAGKVGRIASSDGRIVDYSYQADTTDPGERTLYRVTRAYRTGEAAADIGFTQYTTAGQNITRVDESLEWNGATARTRLVVANTFDNAGRVITQTSRDADTLTFQYNTKRDGTTAPGYTTVTNAVSGDKTEYQTNATGQLVGTKDATGTPSSDTWANRRPDVTTSRGGAHIKTLYDATGRTIGVVYPNATGVLPTGIDPNNPATWGASYEQTVYCTASTCPTGATIPDNRVQSQRAKTGLVTTYAYGDTSNPLTPTTVTTPCDPNSVDTTSPCPAGGAVTTFQYGTGALAGLVTKVTDPDLVVTDTTYNAAGPDIRKVKTVTTHPATGVNLTTANTYAHPGDAGWTEAANINLVTKSTTMLGSATTTKTDTQGRVVETDDPLQKSIKNTYFHTGEVKTKTDQANNTTTYGLGYPTDTGWTEAAGITHIARTVDPLGHATLNRYNGSGDLVQQVRGATAAPAGPGVTGGVTTTSVYGPLGRLTRTTTPPQNTADDPGVNTFLHYNADGQLTDTVTGPADNVAAHTTTSAYNALGQVTDRWGPTGDTDPDGVAVVRTHTTFGYDAAGRKLWQLEGADTVDPVPFTGVGAKLLTAYQYDTAGRPWRIIVHRRAYYDTANPYTLDPADVITETHYSPAGRARQTVTAPQDVSTFDWTQPLTAKRVTTIGYDGAGRSHTTTDATSKTTTTDYDNDSRPQTVTAPLNGATTYVTTYAYDLAGRIRHITTPSGLPTGQPQTVVIDRGYDPRGLMITVTDAHVPQASPDTYVDPSTRTSHYDTAGQLDTVTDANGRIVTYNYDARGNRISRTSKDDANTAIIEDWVYDQADHLIRQTLPHTAAGPVTGTNYHYDTYGQFNTTNDDSGRAATLTYYNTGAIKTDTRTGGVNGTTTVATRLDARGRTTKTVDPTGATLTNYNQPGNIVNVTTPQAPAATTYQWDQSGNATYVTYPNADKYRVLHDPDNRVTQSAVQFGTNNYLPLGTYTYNDGGIATNEALNVYGSSGSRAWTPNAAGQATQYTEANVKADGTFDNYTSTLGYRADQRLGTEAVTNSGAAAPQVNYAYDPAGQLCVATTTAAPTCATTTGIQQAYTYGTRGNRLTQKIGATATYYAYNVAAELCFAGATLNPTCPAAGATQANGVTYAYDAAGRRATETTTNGANTATHTITRSYDSRGLPTQTVTTDLAAATLTETRGYDATNTLAALTQAQSGAMTAYNLTWDHTRPVRQVLMVNSTVNGGAVTVNRLDYGMERLASSPIAGQQPSWYKYDAHGSAINSTGNTTTVTEPAGYDPYGKPTDSNAGTFNFTYRGELTINGLVHLRARDYDPTTGTFLTRDPLGGVNGTAVVANKYHYTGNDPLNRVDPTGMRAKDNAIGAFDGLTYTPSGQILNNASNVSLMAGAGIAVAVAAEPEAATATAVGAGGAGAAEVAAGGILLPVAIAVGIPIAFKEVLDYADRHFEYDGMEYLVSVSQQFVARNRRPKLKQLIYRVWGGCSGLTGASWTPIDPGISPHLFRDFAGLPTCNLGQHVTQALLNDPDAIDVVRQGLPLDGNVGGLLEYLIFNFPVKQALGQVTVIGSYDALPPI